MSKPTLKARLEQATRELDLYRESIAELNSYLNSSKFDIDTTVQVSDISLRITELRLALLRVDI